MRNRKKVVKYKKQKRPNIGAVIFFLIFAYITAYTLFYFFKDKTSIYRVISDTRSDVINQTGIILRNEKVYSAPESGYINYYVNNLSRTGKKDVIYTIDSTGDIYSELTTDKVPSGNTDFGIMQLIKQYHLNRGNFSEAYKFKEAVNEVVMLSSGKSIMTSLDGVLENYGNNDFFYINRATDSGIIAYGTDGYEKFKISDINTDIFEKSADYIKDIPPENSGQIEEGTPIYRLISDEKWNIVLPVDERQYSELNERKTVDLVIDGSSFSARAEVNTMDKNGKFYAVLSLYNYMVDFADKRFVNVNITLKSISGLKIPKTAIVEKNFYLVPVKYLTSGGGSTNNGLNKLVYDEKGNKTVVYVDTDVYYIENDYAYIAADGKLTAGDTIQNNADTTVISKISTLIGVYNVNKGYPLFRRVEVISDTESDYYLISDKTEFGLSEYDNIALNGNIIEDEHNN